VTAELLDQADERRRDALLSTLRWRAAWLAVEPLESRDQWRELARSAPDGWLRLSRATDADERAFAACAALLVGSSDGAVAAHVAGDFPLVLPMRLRPRFE
jgi:sarcosine oxidase gamma subunit